MTKYAIIDIETTGANRNGNKITEIAIIITDGETVFDRFSSLINPERSIPANITYLTGITNEMVMDKPKFYELAKRIVEITQGCVFVAHNVFFDYNFIRNEFMELGFNFNLPKLCTVRMSRKAFPGLKSYSLGNLVQHFNISLPNHHRAMDDANATYDLFKLIKQSNPDLLKPEETRITTLPSQIDPKVVENLPELPGLYYFYDANGELLYIGKSKSIRKRILNHFRPNIKRKKDLQLKNKIAHIDYKLTGNELAALLLESQEIKQSKPYFNHALKSTRFKYGVKLTDAGLKVTTEDTESNARFKSKAQAQRAIDSYISRTFGIPSHEYLENGLKKYQQILGEKEYSQKMAYFFQTFEYPKPNFSVRMRGIRQNEHCILQVKDNSLLHIIYLDSSGELLDTIPLREDRDQRLILINYLKKHHVQLTN